MRAARPQAIARRLLGSRRLLSSISARTHYGPLRLRQGVSDDVPSIKALVEMAYCEGKTFLGDFAKFDCVAAGVGDRCFLDVDRNGYERIGAAEIHEKMSCGMFLVGTLADVERKVNAAERAASEEGGHEMGACVYISTETKTALTTMSVLAVHPSIQGQGVSLKVLDTAFAFAQSQGYSEVESDVLSVKPPLIKFYQKHGWELTGERQAWSEDKMQYVRPEFITAASGIHLMMRHSTDVDMVQFGVRSSD